jgi:hypothetical protein
MATVVEATVTANANCHNIDFTTFVSTFSFGVNIRLFVSGSTTFPAAGTFGSGGIYEFTSTASETITTNGKQLHSSLSFTGSGTWTLQGNLFSDTGTMGVSSSGTFDANGFDVTVPAFTVTGTSNLYMRSGLWTITSIGVAAWSDTTNGTFDAGTSTIKFTGSGTNIKVFSGYSHTYYNVWIATTGTGAFNFRNSFSATSTYNNLKVDAGRTVNFIRSPIVVKTLTAVGTVGNVITFQSETAGTAWSISTTSGYVSGDYLSVQDSHATPTNRFFAGANSTDVSGNIGWVFAAPPTPSTLDGAMIYFFNEV